MDLLSVRVFLIVLAGLLAGYMFMGRGFAHVGVPPLYVGEVVLFVGLIATTIAFLRLKLRVRISPIVWLLVALMAWGLARTVPYLTAYGVDALRDAVLWGYAAFALMVYVLVDRVLALRANRLYGSVVPIFAVWLPICFNVFLVVGASIDPNQLGSDVPLIFFKSGDMSIHIVGSIAFLVLGLRVAGTTRAFLWRSALVVPLLWTAFVAGATNRGGLVSVVIGLSVVAALAMLLRRSRNWYPVLAAIPVVAVILLAPGASLGTFLAAPTGTPAGTPTAAASSPSVVTPSDGDADAEADSASPGVAASAPPGQSADPTTTGPTASGSPAPTGAAAASLAPNSGFELGPINGGVIEGWEVGPSGAYNIVTGGGYRGDNFASMRASAEALSAAMTSFGFPFEAGDDISVSVRARAVTGSPVLEVIVHWYDPSGAHLGSGLADSVETGGDSTWHEGVGILTPPANTAFARIHLQEATGDGATVAIDEVVVKVRQPGFSAASLAPNSGFELGPVNSGTIEGWEVGVTGTYNIVTGGGHRGDNFASMRATGEPLSATMTSFGFPFEAGDDISVSVRVRAITGSPVLEILVHWYDVAGAHLGSGVAGTVETDGDSSWHEGVGMLTPAPGTAFARIHLQETTGDGAAVAIDEVVVRAGDFLDAPPPAGSAGRSATIDQILENIGSIFGSSSDDGLEATRQFRLRWWGTIIEYTVFGEHFWTGKGFGVNLATSDGFQGSADLSLRAPHNSHLTALARMGVPGFILWLAVQLTFGIGLLRAVLAHRRVGDMKVAAVGGWILAYWIAMMMNTSFDPYLEGPQGGIWFWSLFGLGMVVMRLTPRRPEA